MNPLTPHERTARTTRTARTAHSARSSPGARGALPGAARGVAVAAVLLLIPVVVLTGGERFRSALDFTTGVLCLVALTCSIVWGLVASDRLFLSPRQRLLAQAVHRATALASLGFLLLHGTVKLALDHVSAVGALIPFGLGVRGTDGLIGFGSLAGLLMITVGVTGALRSSFASPARIAGRWRALHLLSYPAWCAALVHGLYAGRAPSAWVVTLYCLCLAGVAGALALRAAPPRVKRKVAARVLALLTPEAAAAGPAPVPRRSGPLPGMGTLPEPDPVRPQLPAEGRPGPYERQAAAYDEQAVPYGEQPGPYVQAALYEEQPGPHGEQPRQYGEPPRAGSGMAAAYRAVSSAAGERSAPLREEHAGRWPTPSPPPPGEAARPSGPPRYGTTATPYGTRPTPPDTGPTPYGTDPRPYGTDPRANGTDPLPYEPSTPYDTGPIPPYAPEGGEPAAPERSGAAPLYVTRDPYDTGGTPLHGTPGAVPSPFGAPSAGEPWAPAPPGVTPSTGGRR